MERKIGEIFSCDGDLITVVGSPVNKCTDCYFDGSKCMNKYDERGTCSSDDRTDNRCVIFKKIWSAKTSILDEAKAIVEGSRQSDYGDPVESFNRIAKTASVITGKDLSPKECCAVLMAVKIVRESFKHKRDNLIDLCGYAHIMNELNENESEKEGE